MGKHENQLSMTDQVRIRREKLAALQEEGRDPFQQTKYTSARRTPRPSRQTLPGWRARPSSLAGRIMSKRGMGKVHFLRSAGSTAGASSSTSGLTPIGRRPSSQDFKKYDIGDIVGVEGDVFQTQTGRDVASTSTR